MRKQMTKYQQSVHSIDLTWVTGQNQSSDELRTTLSQKKLLGSKILCFAKTKEGSFYGFTIKQTRFLLHQESGRTQLL